MDSYRKWSMMISAYGWVEYAVLYLGGQIIVL